MGKYREIVGILAGLLTTIAFVPQALKTLRERSTNDISLTMYLLFCSGVALWLVYGVAISAWPIIIANCVTLVLSGAILLLKIKLG